MRVVVAVAFTLTTLLGPGQSAVQASDLSGSAQLPDLGMLAPSDFNVDKKPRGVRWLRFDTVIVNAGTGAFDVVGTNDGATVTQRVQDPSVDGGWHAHATTAQMFYDGDGHRHWHVLDLQEWTLAHVTAPATALRWGAKSGFCFWDNYPYTASDGTEVYDGSVACHKHTNGTIPMGLSVGWGDEYPSTVAGQYIDITNIGYGEYILTVVADQRGDFFESDDYNNSACARIRIARSGVRVLEQDTDLDGTPASCLP